MKTLCVQKDDALFSAVIEGLRSVNPTARYFSGNRHSPPLTALVDDLLELLATPTRPYKKNADAGRNGQISSMHWEWKLDRLAELYEANAESVNLQKLCFQLGEVSMMLNWLESGRRERKSFLIRLFD